MKSKPINDVPDISLIKQKIEAVEYVSFDVFDTLVHRTVKNPVDVFDMVPKYIKKKHKYLYLEHKEFLRSFKKKRIEAESATRKEFHKRYRSHEINLDDIYEHLFYLNKVDVKFLELLKQAEIQLELQVLYPNKYIREVYEYALSLNKKVLVTTDMYLTKPHIMEVLTKCGYSMPHEIFSSGELKYSKGQGDMFTHICQKYKIRPQDVLHLGDNIESDYNIPLKHSINAHHVDYKAAIEKQCAYINKDREYSLTDSLIAGIIEKIKLEEDKSQENNEFYRLGYEVFGPVYTGFFIWLINELKKNPVDKILFFARDAYILRNIYLKYKDLLGINISEEYVYISRASSLLGSFTDFSIERLKYLYAGRVKKTVEYKLNNINIDYREIEEEIEKTGFSNISESVGFTDSKFMNLLIKIPDKIQSAASLKRVNLLKYVGDIIGKDNKIAIVDIGWTGNMQGGFGRIAKLINPKINIFGYYLGTSHGLKRSNLLTKNEYYGYLLNHGYPESLYSDVLSPGGIELLELAFVAPHSTTLDYVNEGGKIKPVLEINHVDTEYQAKAYDIQQGGYKFIEEIMSLLLELGIDNFVNTQWANPFIDLVNHPTYADALLLGEITHTDSSTTTAHRLSLAKKLPQKLRITDPQYIQGYEEAIWKKGFEKLNKQ
jgi:predicted HAD superfamily hydrolase